MQYNLLSNSFLIKLFRIKSWLAPVLFGNWGLSKEPMDLQNEIFGNSPGSKVHVLCEVYERNLCLSGVGHKGLVPSHHTLKSLNGRE